MAVNTDSNGQDVKLDGFAVGLVLPVSVEAPIPPPGTSQVNIRVAPVEVASNGSTFTDYTVTALKTLTIQTLSSSLVTGADAYVLLIEDPSGSPINIEIVRGVNTLPVNQTFSAGTVVRLFVQNSGGGARILSGRAIGYEE